LTQDTRDLFPLLARWAVADDLERSDLVAEADTAALQELVDSAEPQLPGIASFLEADGDEDSAEAFALDALAQGVMEARQELTKRSKVTG
jgi:cob(I)alamin adenosyltransferase